MMMPEKAAPVTGTTLRTTGPGAGGLSAVCMVIERHRYAIARPGKLGADPMAVGGISNWTPPRKAGVTPRVSTRFSLSVKKKQDDAGSDGQTSLARPTSQARTGTGNYSFSLFC